MVVPTVMLKRMYVHGSLRNTPKGFQFALKNRLAPATIVEIGEVHAAGQRFGPEAISIHLHAHTYPGTEISEKRTLKFDINETAIIEVEGAPLPVGEHLLTWRVRTKEVGWLRIPVEDTLGDARQGAREPHFLSQPEPARP